MPFVVFNTLAKHKQPFRSLEPGVVRMYNCGPTVYSRPHVGNYRAFLFADTLRRWLEYLGYRVEQVMNITDVGHLTDDVAGEGDDKIEAQARRDKLDPWQISRAITARFFADLEALGVRRAKAYPRASDHIGEMVEMIEGLIAKGHAYRVDGNVYFDVTTFPRYGELSGNRLDDLEAGARIAVRDEKRNPEDFALWKSDPRHLMKWSTSFGPDGFPGWHIECSAMARKHLGDRLDIHTGGEDNVFPHHECEIAQSESFTGQPFAAYWMHSKFLQVDGGKMSKSLGNVYTLDDVAAHGFDTRQLRYALIRAQYRQPLNFTWGLMEDSRAALAKLDDLVARVQRLASEPRSTGVDTSRGAPLLAEVREQFEAGMNDDLNTSVALAALFRLRDGAVVGDGIDQATARETLGFLERVQGVLGVLRIEEQSLDARVQALIDQRQAARKSKDFARADAIRAELDAQGVVLEDTPKGVVWRKK